MTQRTALILLGVAVAVTGASLLTPRWRGAPALLGFVLALVGLVLGVVVIVGVW